jgi:hypothetical protein
MLGVYELLSYNMYMQVERVHPPPRQVSGGSGRGKHSTSRATRLKYLTQVFMNNFDILHVLTLHSLRCIQVLAEAQRCTAVVVVVLIKQLPVMVLTN